MRHWGGCLTVWVSWLRDGYMYRRNQFSGTQALHKMFFSSGGYCRRSTVLGTHLRGCLEVFRLQTWLVFFHGAGFWEISGSSVKAYKGRLCSLTVYLRQIEALVVCSWKAQSMVAALCSEGWEWTRRNKPAEVACSETADMFTACRLNSIQPNRLCV